VADATTIADALNSVTEDDIVDDEGETKEADQSLLDEPDETEEEPEEEEAEEDEAEEEDKPRGDVEGEEPEEATEAKGEEVDVFEMLTPEQMAEIKANPALNALRKSLMRGYAEKTQEHSQLVQLGVAYRRDPMSVLKAIADSLGVQVAPAAPAAAVAPAAVDPGKELEDLFGPQIGPKVRATFEKWAEARFGSKLAPVEQTLGRVVSQSEAARMFSEEQAFKGRHKDLTPQIEREIVELGNSGKIVPGNMTPAEYLDTLHDVVMARRARIAAKSAGKTASTKLAAKIESNRRDREPSGVSGRGGSVKPVSKIGQARSISEALDFALAELENER
jgi:hypothetical protein